MFSAFAARAVADAAADDDSPSRWSIYALTGGRYDAPTAAAVADAASPTRNVTNVQLWFHGPGEVPENLCCPISMELMAQPVIAADGFTYDRASIEAWLARGKTTSPTTGAPLEHTHLTPNHLVKSMIAEYQESKRLT